MKRYKIGKAGQKAVFLVKEAIQPCRLFLSKNQMHGNFPPTKGLNLQQINILIIIQVKRNCDFSQLLIAELFMQS